MAAWSERKLILGLAGIALALAPVVAAYSQVSETDAVEAESGSADPTYTSLEAALIFDQPVRLVDGLEPAFASDPSLPAPPDESDPSFIERLGRIGERQNLISSLEQEGGAWFDELQDQLMGLGGLYVEQGSYAEAVDAYQRAMQISRINSGLNSLDQVPVVQSLIDSHLAQGEWDKADQYQNYLFYVQSKLYGTDDPRMVPVLYNQARWNLRVFNHRYGESVGLRLTDAYTLFKAASAIVSVHFGNQDERYVAYLRDMAGSAYLVSRNLGLIEEAGRPDYRSAQAMFAERMSQIDPVNAQGYREGEDALQKVVDHYAGLPDATRQLAEARVELGDWYMLFERRRAAEEQYKLAWDLLAALEDGAEHLTAMFGGAVPLPAFSGAVGELAFQPNWQDIDTSELRFGFADVSVDVNAYGQVSGVRVITAEDEENSRIFALLRRKVRATTFRPVLEAGELARSDDNRFRYRYWY